jgi:hypothetical protein
MRRASILLTVAVGLAAPAAVLGAQNATGATRAAILAQDGLSEHILTKCLTVRVTTTGGGNWAAVGFNNRASHSLCGNSAFNGVDIVHRTQTGWHWVTAGSADIPCQRLGIPSAVIQDLTLPCAATRPKSSGSASTCSLAAARAVMVRDKLGNAGYMPDPVQQVLCGPFLGANSRAMVASFAIPTCGGPIGWAVFRPSADGWEIVMQRSEGGLLQAVGSNIKETQNLLRTTDPLCDPTGGTRSRIWHYNGSRFVATPWAYKRT